MITKLCQVTKLSLLLSSGVLISQLGQLITVGATDGGGTAPVTSRQEGHWEPLSISHEISPVLQHAHKQLGAVCEADG